jgi:hypothetical protein
MPGATHSFAADRASRPAPILAGDAVQPQQAAVRLSEGFDFLGFRIQWRRKKGTGNW